MLYTNHFKSYATTFYRKFITHDGRDRETKTANKIIMSLNLQIKIASCKPHQETNLQLFYGSHKSFSLLSSYPALLQPLYQQLLLCQLFIQEVLLPLPQICSQF